MEKFTANDVWFAFAVVVVVLVLMLGSLALLDHGLDGNNIEAMSEAKKKLQEHLAKNNI